MADRFSPDWVTRLDHLVRGIRTDEGFVIQQVVTGATGREEAWYLELGPGGSRVHGGRAEVADVTFTQDRATADAIANGDLSAGAALTAGRLTVRGATARLTEHREALARIDEALADA